MLELFVFFTGTGVISFGREINNHKEAYLKYVDE